MLNAYAVNGQALNTAVARTMSVLASAGSTLSFVSRTSANITAIATAFNFAGYNTLLANLLGGILVNGFALNGGVPQYVEAVRGKGVLALAVAGSVVSLSRLVKAIKSSTTVGVLATKRAISMFILAVVVDVLTVVRFVRLIEAVVSAEVLSVVRLVRVFIATVITASAATYTKRVWKPVATVSTGIVGAVSRTVNLIRSVAVVDVLAVVRFVRMMEAVVSVEVLSVVRLVRVFIATVITEPIARYTKQVWKPAFASTAVLATRIRLAFLVGVRKLGVAVFSVFTANPIYITKTDYKVIVAAPNKTIVVPADDSEIV